MILLDTKIAKIELLNKIVVATWKIEYVDIDIARDAVKVRLLATQNIAYPMLTDIKNVKTMTKEARDFLATEEGCEGIIAAAILIDSSIGSMIGNFFIRISKPLRPTKFFSKEAEALEWLSQFVTK